MKQMSLGSTVTEFEHKTKRTRKRAFLDEMELVLPWFGLVALIALFAPAHSAKGGCTPFPVEVLLRIHVLQQWFNLSDPAMEEALYATPLFREFAGLDAGEDNLPDESTILRLIETCGFRHLLEAHDLRVQILTTVNATLAAKGLLLKAGTAVDATLIAAPSSTQNSTGTRDPEMVSGDESEPRMTRKGNPWHFGMKVHIGADTQSGLVHSVATTAANVHDVTQAHALLHGQETDVFADSGYRGVEKREEVRTRHPGVNWHIAMMPGKRKTMDKTTPMGAILERLEQTQASIRAKVEHPFRVIKRQFGYTKAKYKGLAKNTANLLTLFALSNLSMCANDF